ncbi:protein LEG1 homolog [Cheilinus undulatus]|uniref:protein LEG1 homolog n=1 Tax=Cheilinus undulatus TaxID=241271 RepID=UPI001BD27BF1|nr:protein LEG1 homolog [Cheilinus undulatus]
MMRLVVLGLLACAVSLSYSAVIFDNGVPVLWAQAFGQLDQLPIQNDVVVPNPFNVIHRMSLYKILMAATDWLMLPMGPGVNQNPIWGLPLQLAWMVTSERLADPTNSTTCGTEADPVCISAESWWGCENYLVSVLPFLSAAKNKFFGEGVQVQMQLPEGVTDFCTTHTECSSKFPDAMAKWDAFFNGLISTGSEDIPDVLKKDKILGLYWAAQMASTYASSTCEAKLSHYSEPEKAFLTSWLNLAEFVAAAHFLSSLEKAGKFISPLPRRILKDGDVAPNIEGLTEEENKSLHTFAWLDSLNSQAPISLLDSWKGAMCSVETRAKGAQLLDDVLSAEPYTSISFMGVLVRMATECLLGQ